MDDRKISPPSKKQPSRVAASMLFPPVFARWFVLFLFALGVYFFHGFIVPILAALVVAVATWPLYRRLLGVLGEQRRTIGASIALVVAIVFLVVPLGIMTNYVVREVKGWLVWAVAANNSGAPVPGWIEALPLGGDWLAEQWNLYIGSPGMIGELTQMVGGIKLGALYHNLLATSGSVLHIVLTIVFVLITLFFIYRDGRAFVGQLDRVGTFFFPDRWTRYSRIVPIAIHSTVVGMGIIAIGEGIILGIAYWIAGAPSPVMLGIMTGIMALIPGGAPLAFTLVSVYLMASGAVMEGMLLFIWGCSELFVVDKFLRPRLVGGPMKLPFLPTFFGLVGGVKTMGFLGLFIGPALMALLVNIWREAVQELGKNENLVQE